MAKKSARSKGYRTYEPKKEKKTYTKKEKLCMLIGFAVIVLIIVGVLVVPKIVENSKLLHTDADGAVALGDYEVIVNYGSTTSPKYRHIADIDGCPDGFEFSEAGDGVSDENMKIYYYKPVDEDAQVQTLMVQSAKGSAESMCETYQTQFASFFNQLSASEVMEDEINGRKVYYCVIEYSYDRDSSDEVEDMEYDQSCVLYITSTFGDRSVVVNATNQYTSQDEFVDTELLIEATKAMAEHVVMNEN